MRVKVTVTRTLEDTIELQERGLQTIGEYVDETIRLWTAEEEKVMDVTLSFDDTDRQFMGAKPCTDQNTKGARRAKKR